MSWPDLSPFLPPAVVEVLGAFIATLDEGGRKRLSRALNSVMDEVADRRRGGDPDGDAAWVGGQL